MINVRRLISRRNSQSSVPIKKALQSMVNNMSLKGLIKLPIKPRYGSFCFEVTKASTKS
jgi:hypothetical protein